MAKKKYKFPYPRNFKFKINDDWWECFILTKRETVDLDEKLNQLDEGFRGLTRNEEKCIFICEDSITEGLIAHELFHVFVSYMCLNSSNISVDSFEEIVAEFLETSLDKFIKTRNKLFKKFKQLEKDTMTSILTRE